MKNTDFEKIVLSIPSENWESSIKLGKFVKLKIINTIERHYSIISKCEIIGKTSSKIVYIKIYRDLDNVGKEKFSKTVEKEYENILKWYNFFTKSHEFHVVKPLMVFPEKYMIVIEESKGEKLSTIIEKNGRFFPKCYQLNILSKSLFKVGCWLKYKHNLLLDTNEKYSINDLVDYVDLRLKILTNSKRLIFPIEYRKKVLNFFNLKRRLIRDEELLTVFNHSDFNPGNILIDNNNVTALDFGRFVKGSYLLDVSKLYHHLNLFTFKPYFRRAVFKKLQNALLEGFGNIDADKLLMFRFMLIRNTITHLVNITRFPENNMKEKIYNKWVLHNELKNLKYLVGDY